MCIRDRLAQSAARSLARPTRPAACASAWRPWRIASAMQRIRAATPARCPLRGPCFLLARRRQDPPLRNPWRIPTTPPSRLAYAEYGPVSYTHLDVYKRQPFVQPLSGLERQLGSRLARARRVESACSIVSPPASRSGRELPRWALPSALPLRGTQPRLPRRPSPTRGTFEHGSNTTGAPRDPSTRPGVW